MPSVSTKPGIDPVITKSPKPDLEARRLLLQLSPVRLVDMSKVSVGGVRRSWQLCVKAFASREPVASVADAEIDCGTHRIPLRIYRPGTDQGQRPVLVWFHGGGFVFGDLYTAGATCRALAARSGAIVVAVDYRLLPEHGFGDARADCLAALRWAAGQAAALGGDPRRIAVGGDSAGGTLAALAVLDSVQAGEPIAAMQVLVYPACDIARDHSQSPDTIPVLSAAHLGWLQSLVGRGADVGDPMLSPLKRPLPSDLPKTILVTAGFDPLRDDALAYGRKLSAAGVPVQLLHYPGQFHGFICFDRVLTGAADVLDRIGAALRQGFETGALDETTVTVSVSGAQSMTSRGLLGLHPGQRLREAAVTCVIIKEALERRIGAVAPKVSVR